MVYDVCFVTDITVEAKSDIRDPKDLYLLSMAESVPVDYIVSGDKDLTDLKEHAGHSYLEVFRTAGKAKIMLKTQGGKPKAEDVGADPRLFS
jgi:predicted nucleic acid-binding protein